MPMKPEEITAIWAGPARVLPADAIGQPHDEIDAARGLERGCEDH